jgi:3-methyladenine DNA glycosylase AlkD
MALQVRELVRFVTAELNRAADPTKAAPMAAYMKTDMPFYGVPKPQRVPIGRELKRRFAPTTQKEYAAAVLALWKLPHREEKYIALAIATAHRQFINMESLPLYERLIREGAWWDLVDEAATHLVAPVLLRERRQARRVMNRWIDDDDMWIRRTAILSQIRHKHETDERQLFSHCLRSAGEKEFFIRKAIGWALRDYSYFEPRAVRKFLSDEKHRLSGLSYREGAKQLVRTGMMKADRPKKGG